MHVQGILSDLLSGVIHQKGLNSLILVVTGLLDQKKLSVTALGRAIDLPIQERSAIRRADRLISNEKLQAYRRCIYGRVIKELIRYQKKPCIIVDWTHIPNTTYHLLRAALACKKRAVTLYEEVVVDSKLYHPVVEKAFLHSLHQLLPLGCRPLILTDAGFRNPWFKVVKQFGWDYVGRVRGQGARTYYDGETWKNCTDLYGKATAQVKYVGAVVLGKHNPLETHLFLYRSPARGRSGQKVRVRKHGCRDKRYYRETAKDPWLLVSSLRGDSDLKRKKIIKWYSLRMQIEENFRDLKCARDGLGMENAYSRQIARIEVLLLLAMLALWIAWLIGAYAEKKGYRCQFQSGSSKTVSISLVYLGIQVLKKKRLPTPIPLQAFLSVAAEIIA